MRDSRGDSISGGVSCVCVWEAQGGSEVAGEEAASVV